MNRLLIVFGVFGLIMFTSCETDIDVNADYEDITLVYGVINPQDTTHYIKINKAFLGETSAFDLAANADNFNYDANEISVAVEEYNSNYDLVKAHTVTRTVNEIPKEGGIFDNSSNVLYKFSESNINDNNIYKVRIFNSSLNKEISSETKIVKPITVSVPTGSKFQFWNGTVSTGNPLTKIIGASTGANIGRIEAIIVFNYIEHPLTSTGNPSVAKKLEMSLGEKFATTSLGGELFEWELPGETFFDNIKSAIKPITVADSLSHRELDNISMKFLVAGTELHTFMVVTEPSTSVNQDKPKYTNIENGIGVFSSREYVLWESSIDPQAQNQINIQNSTITYLQNLNRGFCFGTTTVGFPVAPCVQQ